MRDPIPQILLATDFSEGCAPAAETAAEYARRLGARLHVLHVTPAAWHDEMLEALRAYVGRFADLPVTAGVEAGNPADRIVAYADRNAVELIVLGARGHTGFSQALLGSVADRVARTAHCPVLTVPRDLHAAPLRAVQPVPGALTIVEPPAPPRNCLVCSTASDTLICEACQARIRGEALERKLEDQKVGG